MHPTDPSCNNVNIDLSQFSKELQNNNNNNDVTNMSTKFNNALDDMQHKYRKQSIEDDLTDFNVRQIQSPNDN